MQTLGEKVYEWLKDEKHWCKGYMFTDKKGNSLSTMRVCDKERKDKDKVCQTCLMGAFLLFEPNAQFSYWDQLKKITKYASITVWNDRGDTSHKDVLKAVKEVIKWEKGQVENLDAATNDLPR